MSGVGDERHRVRGDAIARLDQHERGVEADADGEGLAEARGGMDVPAALMMAVTVVRVAVARRVVTVVVGVDHHPTPYASITTSRRRRWIPRQARFRTPDGLSERRAPCGRRSRGEGLWNTCTPWSGCATWTRRSTSIATSSASQEVRRIDNEQGRFTLVFLAAPDDVERARAEQRADGRADLQLGRQRTTPAAATSATWPMRSTTSTPPASG